MVVLGLSVGLMRGNGCKRAGGDGTAVGWVYLATIALFLHPLRWTCLYCEGGKVCWSYICQGERGRSVLRGGRDYYVSTVCVVWDEGRVHTAVHPAG